MKKYDQILEELRNILTLIESELKELHLDYFLLHRNRYKSDLEIIKDYYRKGKILEIGSFPCHLTYCLTKLGYPVIGIDINPERIKNFIEKHNLTVKKCDIEKERIPFDNNRFDFVIFNEVFEHLRIDPISTLKEINRVMKPAGIMVLSTPNLYSLRNIVLFNIGRGFNNAYREFEKLHTIGHMGHIREYSTREIKQFLENTGFEIVEVKYKVYNRTNKKIIGPILDLCYFIISKWRPFQIIISKKRI